MKKQNTFDCLGGVAKSAWLERRLTQKELAVGSEQGGIRPVLIIQNNTGNKHSPTVIIAAITSKAMKATLPTHCILSAHAGLDRDSIALMEQFRTIDKRRLKDYVGALGQNDKALTALLRLA